MKRDQALSLAATHAAELGVEVPHRPPETPRQQAAPAPATPVRKVETWIRKNPWRAAGVTFVAGALIGFSLPRCSS